MKRLLPALLTILIFNAQPALKAEVPQQLNYQGRIAVQGVNFNGTGQFKFALVGAPENLNTQATATPVIGGLGDGMGPRVLAINVSNGGSGYAGVPAVTITHPTGSGAAATAVLTDGVVTAITVTSNGLGYGGPDTDTVVTIAPPPVNLQSTIYWSNAGDLPPGEVPATSVALPVTQGLYSVRLGDTSLPNMAAFFNPDIFYTPLFLRVWFDDGVHGFQQLTPDQPLAAAPYALRAQTAVNVETAAISTPQLADQSVTAAKLAPASVTIDSLLYGNAEAAAFAKGGQESEANDNPQVGQLLSFDGQGFAWVTPGLQLPFSGSVAAGLVTRDNGAFSVANAGEGFAIHATGAGSTPPFGFGRGGAISGRATGVIGFGILGEATAPSGIAGYFINSAGGIALSASGGVRMSHNSGFSLSVTGSGTTLPSGGGRGGAISGQASASTGIAIYGEAANVSGTAGHFVNTGGGAAIRAEGKVVAINDLEVFGNILHHGAIQNLSDERLKDISGEFPLGLSEITQLTTLRYKFKSGTDAPPDESRVGVTAQALREVMPEAVKEDSYGNLLVSTEPVFWAMVNSIKELKAQNDTLKRRLEALEAQLP